MLRILPSRWVTLGLGCHEVYPVNGNILDATVDNLAVIHGRLQANRFVLADAAGAELADQSATRSWSNCRADTALRLAVARDEKPTIVAGER